MTWRLSTRGVPVPVLEDVADDAEDRTAHFDCAGNGTLAYLSRKTVSSLRTLAWIDWSGGTEALLDLPEKYAYISPSPDGERLAFVSRFPENIFVYDFQRRRSSRLTFATSGNVWPVWSPDGTHLVFSALNGRPGGRTIWWAHATGAGEPQALIESEEELHPSSFSPDGRHIAVHRRSPDTLYDIWMLPLDTSDPEHPKAGALEPFLRTPVNEWGAVFSPNDQWISYYSEASGTGEIYVRPSRGSGGPWLVSTGSGISGTTAHWPRRGRSLFYLSSDRRIMEVTYSEEVNAFDAEEPRVWSPTPLPLAAFNMASDGERAIIAVPANSEESRRDLRVTFLLNFFDELNRRVPAR